MSLNSFNVVSISTSALQANYKYIKSRVAADIEVMAMVKADAYGHDMIRAALAFAEVGCKVFGVAELCEAVNLRKSGVEGQIFVMLGFDDDDAEQFFDYDLTPVIYNYNSALSLSAIAGKKETEIEVHLKVDTGMTRLGKKPEELSEFYDKVEQLSGIKIAGVMSHFPESDDSSSRTTEKGLASFQKVCDTLGDTFNGVCHIANSGAVLSFPTAHCDMVRAGIALYGYHPAGKQGQVENRLMEELVPAMTFSTQILQLKTVPEGTGVSYGHTFTTDRKTTLAVLPVGYEDGFSRILSNCGEVLIRGQRAQVCGRVCMNICMVDVTDIDGVSVGDEVVILGNQGLQEITADDIAEKTCSISYEVLCLFGNNNKRVYRE